MKYKLKTEELILEKLDTIESELRDIKGRIVDLDTFLTEEDINSIKEAEKELKEGKTTSHESLKKELGL